MFPLPGTVDGLFTTMVAEANPPAAIVPSVHVTVVVPVQAPGGVADTSVAPGNWSWTVTPAAADPPVFVTLTTYVTLSPAWTGSGLSVIVVTNGFVWLVMTRISSI